MQQRLMLRRRPRRSRLCGHRLYTLALAREDQPGAIVAQRANPVGVPEHARKPRHIRRKSCFGLLFLLPIHVSTSRANPESSQIVDSQSRSVRPSDSVRFAHPTISTQIEKLVPQPQDAVALGLTTRNDAPIRSSTKSTSDPARNGTEAGSTSTTAPSRAITKSSSACARSMSNLY